MESNRKVVLLASGVILLSFSFFEFLPAGPWLDASFSRGMSGLLGLSFSISVGLSMCSKKRELFQPSQNGSILNPLGNRCGCRTFRTWFILGFWKHRELVMFFLNLLQCSYVDWFAYHVHWFLCLFVTNGPLKDEEE